VWVGGGRVRVSFFWGTVRCDRVWVELDDSLVLE